MILAKVQGTSNSRLLPPNSWNQSITMVRLEGGKVYIGGNGCDT